MTTGIGTYNEKPLHASLKQLYQRPGDRIEVPIDGYVVDILRSDLIIEIQTANFASIAKKMRDLSSRHQVRLVYPVPHERWIVKLPTDANGQTLRRRSPKRGRVEDVFAELVSFPDLIAHENFELEVILTREEQLRRFDGRRGRSRRGWVVVERRLLGTTDRVLIRSPGDLVRLLPSDLPDPFHTLDLAVSFGRSRALAQKAAYCLRNCHLITAVGKDANAVLYTRTGAEGSLAATPR